MNQYGRQAMQFWADRIPDRLAALPDPEQYFQSLGDEIENQVIDLSMQLQGQDPSGEEYLGKVGRLMNARRRAEEIVMAQLVWEQDPVLPLAAAREEWEQTTASEEALISWAERIQDRPDPRAAVDELDEMSDRWAVSVRFLEDLVATEPPREHMLLNRSLLDEAKTIRFLREIS